jgi:hypothetical protein
MTLDEYNKKKTDIMKAKWADPEYRAKMLQKQKSLGLRNYG